MPRHTITNIQPRQRLKKGFGKTSRFTLTASNLVVGMRYNVDIYDTPYRTSKRLWIGHFVATAESGEYTFDVTTTKYRTDYAEPVVDDVEVTITNDEGVSEVSDEYTVEIVTEP